ncbi:hypothetical protein REPUB_Repub10bG0115300 [Reevesia pubescens]
MRFFLYPYSTDDFKNQDIPPSDDDSWLYSGEDELNYAIEDRQMEMELFELRRKKKNRRSNRILVHHPAQRVNILILLIL